jgi:hypothetical protein
MALFWFCAGALTSLGLLVILLPWLRNITRLASLPILLSWKSSTAVAIAVAAILGVSFKLASPDGAASSAARASSSPAAATAFGSAAKMFADSTGESGSAGASANTASNAASKPAAGSMNSAIASLEARLAKGGGSADDWELLAKSFEFLGRPADAALARARKLPAVPSDADASATAAASPAAAAAAHATAVSGEVTLAPALQAKAAAGETLFIVAKSVDSPGIPVAVFRGSVGSWPLKFTLDDSQSMLPGRNLSSAGRVTIEARISQKGQAQPASGDLQGSSGVINPGDHPSLKILIDRVIS